mmetsp:Transcript_4386/g.10853  ORF Transcript_4386/g.10853 Transcript_4386/m.10853 type:complete len:96 (+) Transcript_4386:56-343(+)
MKCPPSVWSMPPLPLLTHSVSVRNTHQMLCVLPFPSLSFSFFFFIFSSSSLSFPSLLFLFLSLTSIQNFQRCQCVALMPCGIHACICEEGAKVLV